MSPRCAANQGREQADRPGASHQHRPRLPERALADGLHLFPRLGHDGGGLEQHAQQPERAVHLHRVFGLDPPALGHETVDLLDAALGVLAIPAHVPLADRAVGAGHGIRAPDDARDEVAFLESAARARVQHAAKRFVTEHEARLTWRGPAVLALHNLDVGAADPDRNRFDQDRPVARVGFGDLFQARGLGLVRFDGDGLHMGSSLQPGLSLRSARRHADGLREHQGSEQRNGGHPPAL